MKLLDAGFIILLSLLGLARKASCNLLLGLLLPLRNLIWMHAMLAGKLGQALLARQGIKGDAGLEFGGELPSRFGHKKPPLTSYVHLSSRSSFPNPLLGIQIYLDDFGTGYSSLYYLHTMPIASLKIDKSFIDAINAPLNASNELVKTVLTLASGLGMATVAEGVETREQLDFLAENGCSTIQGYIFSQALSGSDFATYLEGSAKSIAAVMA